MGTKHKDADISTQHKPRYRYSGKENQLEAMNGILDFGSRYYNPQIGRWLHPDPQAESYYQYSPYTYCANNPTNLIDPDGERIVVTDYYSSRTQSNNVYEWTLVDDEWKFVEFFTRTPYEIGSSSYVDALISTLKFEMSGPNGKMYIEKLVELDKIVLIDYNIRQYNTNRYIPLKDDYTIFINGKGILLRGAINWYSPENMSGEYMAQLKNSIETEYNMESSSYVLIHELAHFYDHVNGRNMERDVWDIGDDSVPKVSESEKYAMHVENIIRVEHGSDIRIRYRDSKGFSSGNDFVIDVNTGRALFFMTGNIFDTQIINLEKHELGYKYK